ncbi:hypothetical protein QJS04_geneDACA018490 [Acorus gramineus]|uniref:Uncharacterized protein n=1 Tax=Acorus gramineus TaxID=55184 RepID=A0AAV9B0V6_ACOGR|nr:hypothetical protein QJS04_geneDACA018490 [Acorus gramineus]
MIALEMDRRSDLRGKLRSWRWAKREEEVVELCDSRGGGGGVGQRKEGKGWWKRWWTAEGGKVKGYSNMRNVNNIKEKSL